MNWIDCGRWNLVTGRLLLLAGSRRAGWFAAASGTALAMLDQQQTLHLWNALPCYIDQVQQVLNRVQSTVEDVAAKREALRRALAR